MLGHGLALLCVLSAAAFPAAAEDGAPSRALRVGGAVAGFVAGALWLTPEPSWVGTLVVVVAGALLRWPRLGGIAMVAAGVTSGAWASILHGQGFPLAPAWILAGGLPIVSVLLAARHSGFAPTVLREEALLTVCLLGLIVAVGPTVSAGWGSASVLNLDPAGGVRQVMGVWIILMGGASVVLGGWHSLRRRR